MDVLQYWSPAIEWENFRQGDISDPIWDSFKDIVTLSHAVTHWRDQLETQKAVAHDAADSESKYDARKRREAQAASVQQTESRMNRAAYLAGDKLIAIVQMAGERAGAADWDLSLALLKTVGEVVVNSPMRGYERGAWPSLALDRFDAVAELADGPDALAERWGREGALLESAVA